MNKGNNIVLPPKQGYRIVGFDQATLNFGYSVHDGGSLVKCGVLTFSGATENRLITIGTTVEKFLTYAAPDLVVYEDIQQQGGAAGYKTFKLLAELKGIIGYVVGKAGIPNFCVLNKVWQAQFGIKGSARIAQKQGVIEKVAELYPKIGMVSDDIADAILIGRYGAERKQYYQPKLF